MSEQQGEVEIAGTLAGPESAWPLTEAALAAALKDSGMPPGSLRLLREGGWLTIEPTQGKWSDQAFHGEPGLALGETVRSLSSGARLPEDWGSTLRITHYGESEKVETLVSSTEEGVQAVARRTPWKPVPKESPTAWLQRNWLVAATLVLAFGGLAWIQRDAIAKMFSAPAKAEATDQGAESETL